MREHDIYPRVLDFASRVVKMNKALVKDPRVDRNAINQQSNCITEKRIAALVKEAGEIVAILTTIAKNANPDNPPDVDS